MNRGNKINLAAENDNLIIYLEEFDRFLIYTFCGTLGYYDTRS